MPGTYYVYAIVALWPRSQLALYVGLTDDFDRRLREHRKRKGWTARMVWLVADARKRGARLRMRVLRRGPSEAWARREERHWIERLRPAGNSTNGG